MIWFVGAGPGAVDLITVRGQKLLETAEVVVYAGSLVNADLLDCAPADCEIHNSAPLTLEEVMELLMTGHRQGKQVVRLHTGDPSLYGAIREQMDWLRKGGIPFRVVPGVSSFLAAAAALEAEYTLPEVSQTVILTRTGGRTSVPEGEELYKLATHGSSMAVFLSAGLLEETREQLLRGGWKADSPAAIVYKASWPEERVVRTTVGELPQAARDGGITKTALVLVGDFLGGKYGRSKLYDGEFTHEYRRGNKL